MKSTEEVLLDINDLAQNHDYFNLGAFSISHDQNKLAYSIDTSGREIYKLYVKDLTSKQLLHDQIDEIIGNVTWSKDDQFLFYIKMDETLRPHQLYRHKMDSNPKEDQLVYEESDPKFRVDFGESRSEDFLFLYSESSLTTEIRFLSSSTPLASFQIFSPRHTGHEYRVEHQGSRWLILTNDSNNMDGSHNHDAQNFKLMEAPLDHFQSQYWKELIPHRKSVELSSVEGFEKHFIIFEREEGLEHIRVFDLENSLDYRIPMPEPVFSVWNLSNPNNASRKFIFGYMSLISPTSYYEWDLESKTLNLLKEVEIIGYNKEQYHSERIWAPAKDGTQIPLSIVYKKDLTRSQTHPLFLYGYGAYGINLDPYFSSARISLMDRGVIYVISHVRGGGEMGRHWYEDGKFLNKRNTFTDFIDSAEHLISEGYTSAEKLAISGGSAGGLLIGACINMRPDLFMSAIADVPFVDVVTTMMDESIPLTTNEWEEWGNPQDQTFFDYMLSYSPYDNVIAQNYPNLLVTSGLYDPRVQYWEPTKWVARLRDTKTDNNTLLLKTNMTAGHAGASGRYGRIEETAFSQAWLLSLWGLE